MWVARIGGEPELAMHVTQQRVERVGRGFVEIAGRLVGQQQRRLRDQRPGDGHALLLAAGQHARTVLEPPFQPHSRQQRRGARPRFRHAHPRDPQRHLGILDGREFRQQVVELEHEADIAIPESDEIGIGHLRHAVIADVDDAGIGRPDRPSKCSSVLLPTPDAPMIATISPRSTVSERSRSACRRRSATG